MPWATHTPFWSLYIVPSHMTHRHGLTADHTYRSSVLLYNAAIATDVSMLLSRCFENTSWSGYRIPELGVLTGEAVYPRRWLNQALVKFDTTTTHTNFWWWCRAGITHYMHSRRAECSSLGKREANMLVWSCSNNPLLYKNKSADIDKVMTDCKRQWAISYLRTLTGGLLLLCQLDGSMSVVLIRSIVEHFPPLQWIQSLWLCKI